MRCQSLAYLSKKRGWLNLLRPRTWSTILNNPIHLSHLVWTRWLLLFLNSVVVGYLYHLLWNFLISLWRILLSHLQISSAARIIINLILMRWRIISLFIIFRRCWMFLRGSLGLFNTMNRTWIHAAIDKKWLFQSNQRELFLQCFSETFYLDRTTLLVDWWSWLTLLDQLQSFLICSSLKLLFFLILINIRAIKYALTFSSRATLDEPLLLTLKWFLTHPS